MGARYQCSTCDGYLSGGTERSRCKCGDREERRARYHEANEKKPEIFRRGLGGGRVK